MADIHVFQGFVLAGTESDATINVPQAYVLAATQFPTETLEVTQARVDAATASDNVIEVTQAYVLVAVKGRIYDPKVRTWTMTLDGHDNYVLRLGGLDTTLVYDDHSESWYTWGTKESNLWRAYHGTNWGGATNFAGSYGSNIVVGDDGNGALYFLDPDLPVDDSAVDGNAIQYPFQRLTMAQAVTTGYEKYRCFGVHVYGSVGQENTVYDDEITLLTSDDRGETYDNRGAITITEGTLDTRLSWRSLGSISAPGRLFKLRDYGSLKRIDSIEMEDGQKNSGG